MLRNRRKTQDRRANNHRLDRLFGCNRRYRADRRLNSIQVEWIPIDSLRSHPAARQVFGRG